MWKDCFSNTVPSAGVRLGTSVLSAELGGRKAAYAPGRGGADIHAPEVFKHNLDLRGTGGIPAWRLQVSP